MTKNQKTSFLVGGICLLIAAVLAAPSIYSAFYSQRLRSRLDDPNPAVRVAAIRATGDEGHVDMLMKALQDEDADVRLVAAMHLRQRRAEAAPSAKALLMASVKDDHAGVRREAAETLHAIGAAAAPTLIDALGDPDPRVRAKAARALRVVAFMQKEQGPPSVQKRPSTDELASAAAALEKVLQDEDSEVRENAADSLTHIRRAAAGEWLYEGK